MNRSAERQPQTERHELAALASDIRVRVLNVSAAGCLIEATRPLELGTVATLRITFAGGDFEDTVQVVRCQEITGAGTVFHLGTTFLAVAAPSIDSLRFLIRRQSGSVGYMRLTTQRN